MPNIGKNLQDLKWNFTMIRCKWTSKREGGQGACEKRYLLDKMGKNERAI